MTSTYTLPLDTNDNGLEVIGGKGRSLSRLIHAGFDVPGGFHVPTSAYRTFIGEHALQARLLDLTKPAIVDGIASFEQAAQRIRQVFDDLELTGEIADQIRAAYDALEDNPAVAVRSSANAEDLPDLSFAGQQDTYLNVNGVEATIAAVKNCWASLWNAQAINYRHEMGVDQSIVAMAVVIQTMVQADTAGILFTANPANGERSEMIVNASFGLGEAVVSGQVTADTYIVDRASLQAKESIIGTKTQIIVADPDSGTRTDKIDADRQSLSSLSDVQIRDLAKVAIEIEGCFDDVPQDIEWAFSGDPSDMKLWLLQARPITNLLPPPPQDVTWPEIPGAQLMKRQVAENMPDPLSPLFEDLYLRGIYDTQKWPDDWEWNGRLTKNWMKNFVVSTVNGYAYQAIYNLGGEDWQKYMADHKKEQTKLPWYANLKRAFSMHHYYLEEMKGGPLHPIYLLASTFRIFRKYPALITWEVQQLPDYLAAIERWRTLDPGQSTDTELLNGIKALTKAEAAYWHALRSVIGTAKITDGGFQTFLETNSPDEGFISGSFLSGFASRTLDAEFAMRAIADQIRSDSDLCELVLGTPVRRVLNKIANHENGATVRKAVDDYLHEYGRQVFNLDFVEPTLAEQPVPFVMSLQALVRNPGFNLRERQRNVAHTRRAKFVQALKFFQGKMRFEFLRFYFTARVNYPTREAALFYMGLAWSTLRPWALELGKRLVASGSLSVADDVFYLTSEKLTQAIQAGAELKAQPDLVQDARAQRELRAQRFRMNQPQAIPPLKNDKSPLATLRNNDDDASTLRGFAVSPGTVTGIASVVLTPNDFDQMKPGTILVCPLTTPAWTQLFPHATGLVTDIGSILAHGSIVAREYGIPAVLGIGDVTQRVKSGQTITVDGNRGTVVIADDPAEKPIAAKAATAA